MHVSFRGGSAFRENDDQTVVIGSGAVGLYFAVQYAKVAKNVVLLESGSSDLGGFKKECFRLIGRTHRGIHESRSRSLGGTTNLWGGQLVEFMPVDFEKRPWETGEPWPIPFSELQRYYKKTYKELGITPNVWEDADVWRDLRVEQPQLLENLEVFFTRWMKVPNLALLYREQIESSENLTVVTDATVNSFRFKGKRVTEARISDGNGCSRWIRGKEFVLAAGTIENSRLLLHAGTQEECPWSSNQMIGKRFQDHLGGRIADVIPSSKKRLHEVFSTAVLGNQKLQPKIRPKNEDLQATGSVNLHGMLAFDGSVSENLVFLKQFVKAAVFSRRFGSLRELLRNFSACRKFLFPLMWRYVVQHRIFIPGDARISLHVQSETIPISDSSIGVDQEVVDQYDLPQVVLNWQVSGRELPDIRVFAERVAKALDEAKLAELVIDKRLLREDPAFLETLYDTGHQAGGCLMGATPDSGVVDQNLKVFGTENFYILGACVFRSCSNANTTFTAMTLATRLCEHLRGSRDAPG